MKILYKFRENKILPAYMIIPLVMCGVINMLVYYGAMYINQGRIKYELTTAIDELMPLIPSWITIYYLAFPFWIIFYILIMRVSKQESLRFSLGEIMGKLICGLIYLLYPTTNVRPIVNSTGIYNTMLVNLYKTDLPENLLPSIHCYISWLCFIGILYVHKKYKVYSRWWVIFAFIFAVLICLSTMLIKQHVIYDVLFGIALAQICFYIAHKIRRVN